MLAMQGLASTHMLAIMAQSADPLFSTVNQQLLRIFSAAEAAAAADGSQPSSRGAKYALNIMLQVGVGVGGASQDAWPCCTLGACGGPPPLPPLQSCNTSAAWPPLLRRA